MVARSTAKSSTMKSKALTKAQTKKGAFAKSLVKTSKDKEAEGAAAPARGRGEFVPSKSERGQGLKFPLEMYQKIAACKPGTKVKYAPNPKRPGSKSFVRYAKYEKAKTIGESLKNGSKVADLMWELQRGILTILGGERSTEQEIAAIGKKHYDEAEYKLNAFVGPRGIAFNINDERASEHLKKEEEWRKKKLSRCEKLAKQLGMKPETADEIEAQGINEALDIRLQRRVADRLSEEKLKAADAKKRKVPDSDLQEVLECWGFSQNTGRLNVMPEGQKYVYSDTLGAIRRRTGGVGLTPPTARYPNFSRILMRWLQENLPNNVKGTFVCSAINLNANYAGKRHRDANNEGPSIIRAFGKFKGGSLRYWPKDKKKAGKTKPPVETLKASDAKVLNLKTTTVVFDGNRAHEVEKFEGERYSIVFFTAKGYGQLPANLVKAAKSFGYPWPTPAAMTSLKKAAFGKDA